VGIGFPPVIFEVGIGFQPVIFEVGIGFPPVIFNATGWKPIPLNELLGIMEIPKCHRKTRL